MNKKSENMTRKARHDFIRKYDTKAILMSQPWWLDFMKDHKIVPSYLEARWSAIENGGEK